MKREWRCTRCGKLLGVLGKGRVHIRLTRGHEYLAGFPVTGTCRGCHSLNEIGASQGEGEAVSACQTKTDR